MKNAEAIRWGILGCGDVCEVKSGPAFNKVEGSRLDAVMRRDKDKAQDFAKRHGVPKFYSDADDLINDDEINAIYIATPPAFHEEYALQVMRAGKPVYIEKPVTLDSNSCGRILELARQLNAKVTVAHYRRGLPLFKKIRSLLNEGVIGKPSLILSHTLQAPARKIGSPDYWRINPELSGGGLFFDLAPHQLDIFYWLFGRPNAVNGRSLNQKRLYPAPDLTTVEAIYTNGIYLRGVWAFNVSEASEEEYTEIIGDKGKIGFSFFKASPIDVTTSEGTQQISADFPVNIQQPMIQEVVNYFRGVGPNPCSLEDALVTMQMMDATKGDESH
jgi:predicted dehydrogenase